MINLKKSFSLSPPPFCTSFDSDGNCIGCFPEIIGVGSSPHNSALHISKSEASVCSATIPVGGPKELEQRRVACGFLTVTRHLSLGFLFLEP